MESKINKVILGIYGAIGLCLLFISIWITITFFMAKPMPAETKVCGYDEPTATTLSDAELNNEAINAGVDPDKVDDLDRTEKEKIYLSDEDYRYNDSGINLISENSSAEQLSEEQGQELYAQLLTYLSVYDYDAIQKEVTSTLNNYHISSTPLNHSIAALYSDALSMLLYPSVSKQAKELLLKEHQSPVGLAVDGLFALPRRRESVILDPTSKVPLAEDGVVILEIKNLNETARCEEYLALMNDIRNVISIRMQLRDSESEVEAIVLETNDRINRLVGYYSDDAGMLSVAERQAIGGDFE